MDFIHIHHMNLTNNWKPTLSHHWNLHSSPCNVWSVSWNRPMRPIPRKCSAS